MQLNGVGHNGFTHLYMKHQNPSSDKMKMNGGAVTSLSAAAAAVIDGNYHNGIGIGGNGIDVGNVGNNILFPKNKHFHNGMREEFFKANDSLPNNHHRLTLATKEITNRAYTDLVMPPIPYHAPNHFNICYQAYRPKKFGDGNRSFPSPAIERKGKKANGTVMGYSVNSNEKKPLMLVCNLRSKQQFIYNTNQLDPGNNLYQFFKYTTPTLHHSFLRHSCVTNEQKMMSTSSCPYIHTKNVKKHNIEQEEDERYDYGFNSCCYYHLKSLWNFYDEPYGIDIPIVIEGRTEHVYFVPHLSAIQLYKRSEQPCQDSLKDPLVTNKENLIFEYFEMLSPDLRYPLIDKIEELAQTQCPLLLDGTTLQLDPHRSWYSIAWYPILCHTHTIPWLKGQIITYHNFTPSIYHQINPVFCDPEFKREFRKGIAFLNERSQLQRNTSIANVADGTDSFDTFFAAPVIGFLPYKVRNETWFISSNAMQSDEAQMSEHKNDSDKFYAPLHLLRACKRILSAAGARHADFDHCIQNCIELGSI